MICQGLMIGYDWYYGDCSFGVKIDCFDGGYIYIR